MDAALYHLGLKRHNASFRTFRKLTYTEDPQEVPNTGNSRLLKDNTLNLSRIVHKAATSKTVPSIST